MKKIIILFLLALLLVSCGQSGDGAAPKNEAIDNAETITETDPVLQITSCQSALVPEGSGDVQLDDSFIIAHFDEEVIYITYQFIDRIDIDIYLEEDYMNSIIESNEAFNEIPGIFITHELDLTQKVYSYNLRVEFLILDFDALEKLYEDPGRRLEIDIQRNYLYSDYIREIEKWDNVCGS